MRVLHKPQLSIVEIFYRCVDATTDAALRVRLQSITPEIEAAYAAYDTAAPLARLHTISQRDVIAGAVPRRKCPIYTIDRWWQEGAQPTAFINN